MTWPEGDELLPNEIRPAGTPIGMFLVFLVCVCILNTEKMLFFLTFHGKKNDKKLKRYVKTWQIHQIHWV